MAKFKSAKQRKKVMAKLKKKGLPRKLSFYRGQKKFIRQGGISKQVWNQKDLKEYRESPIVAGYVGAPERTVALDKFTEKQLRKQGLGPKAIGIWMTSTDGRHYADDALSFKTGKLHIKRNKDYLKDAGKKVCLWEDPRHTGFAASTEKLQEEYTPEKVKKRLKEIG